MSVSVQSLLKKYGEQTAVNHISFEVQPGSVTGFLGPNGAGKSTTFKMITGFLSPDAGRIEIEGKDATISTSQTRSLVGYLPEANPLYTDMYVREYLQFVAGVHQLKQKEIAVKNSIEKVGLQLEAHKKIGQLSKGYKQRVGLAAALIHNPPVLILDEPTSGLDPNQIVEIREVIKTLAQEKTVLLSSHIMQEIEAICQQVIIINRGNIVANNSVGNLRKSASGGHTVSVSFAEKVNEKALLALPSADGCAQQGEALLISTHEPEKLKQEILQFSISNNYNIVALQTQTNSLEDVFRQLTQSTATA